MIKASRAGNNRRRSSRVSVASTTRSTSSGGNALVNAPTDTRSGNQPSGETPSDPSCATTAIIPRDDHQVAHLHRRVAA